MRIAVSREQIAQRARALLAPAYGLNLDLFTFSNTGSGVILLIKSDVVRSGAWDLETHATVCL